MTEENLNLIEQAKVQKEALEKALSDVKEERERFEQLRTEQILSGRADAGQVPAPKAEIDARTYAKAALKGQILK